MNEIYRGSYPVVPSRTYLPAVKEEDHQLIELGGHEEHKAFVETAIVVYLLEESPEDLVYERLGTVSKRLVGLYGAAIAGVLGNASAYYQQIDVSDSHPTFGRGIQLWPDFEEPKADADDQVFPTSLDSAVLTGVSSRGSDDEDDLDSGGLVIEGEESPYRLTIAERFRRLLRLAPKKVSWADAIGLVYSEEGFMREVGWKSANLDVARERGIVLSIETSDGARVYPAEQILPGGSIVQGVSFVLSQLSEDVVDRYTLTAWMNAKRPELGGKNVWEELRSTSGVPGSVKRLVRIFRGSLLG
jgi:hypothetical protein